MELAESVKALMKKNRRTINGHQFTVPASDRYPFQWLWDSCFHALILASFETASAKKELQSALAHPLPSGLLPHMMYWLKDEEEAPNWGREQRGHEINALWQARGTSTITQVSLLAQVIWHIYELDLDRDFVRSVYGPLRHHFTHLMAERTFGANSLLYIINPDESGEDNSPRYDTALGLPPQHTADQSLDARLNLVRKNADCEFVAKGCMDSIFGVADVSFNILYVEELIAMARIAHLLDHPEEAQEYSDWAIAMQCDVMAHLKQGDLYLSFDHVRQQPITVLTWNIFMPLYGGFLSEVEAESLVKKYLFNPEYFLSPYGIVTTAKTEASYDPGDGFWRGPVWHAPHWFIYHGLKRYGFLQEAAEIKAMSVRLIEQSGFREYYHPETGEGQGAQDFTWGGLVLDMN